MKNICLFVLVVIGFSFCKRLNLRNRKHETRRNQVENQSNGDYLDTLINYKLKQIREDPEFSKKYEGKKTTFYCLIF